MSTLVVENVPNWQFPEIELPESMRISPAGFKELCSRNQILHAELTSDGKLIIMAPTGGNSGWRNSEISADLSLWARKYHHGFPPLCPDFFIELRSKTDRLAPLQAKIGEFIANGTLLGFLIDPNDGCAHIYRPGTTPQILIKPDTLSGDPELPGLVIDLTKIW